MDKLDIESIVYVTIPTITVPVQGIIHFIGTLPKEAGTKFGIEFLVCYISVSVCILTACDTNRKKEEKGQAMVNSVMINILSVNLTVQCLSQWTI